MCPERLAFWPIVQSNEGRDLSCADGSLQLLELSGDCNSLFLTHPKIRLEPTIIEMKRLDQLVGHYLRCLPFLRVSCAHTDLPFPFSCVFVHLMHSKECQSMHSPFVSFIKADFLATKEQHTKDNRSLPL